MEILQQLYHPNLDEREKMNIVLNRGGQEFVGGVIIRGVLRRQGRDEHSKTQEKEEEGEKENGTEGEEHRVDAKEENHVHADENASQVAQTAPPISSPDHSPIAGPSQSSSFAGFRLLTTPAGHRTRKEVRISARGHRYPWNRPGGILTFRSVCGTEVPISR